MLTSSLFRTGDESCVHEDVVINTGILEGIRLENEDIENKVRVASLEDKVWEAKIEIV